MSLWGQRPFLAVRLLGSDGYYPHMGIRSPTHRYEASEELVWTAVLQKPLPEGWEAPEHPTLIPEEIRLLAALAFSEGDPWSHGMPVLTLGSARWEENVEEGFDLTSKDGVARIDVALGNLRKPGVNPRFQLRPTRTDEDPVALLENFDSEDELLLAGVNSLHTAVRLLSPHINELEAASLCLFVAMGAALEFIRLHLNDARGTANTSFAEVHQYLGMVYPAGNVLPDYLERMYEHRLIATHPAGRFGEYWTPPLMVGDIYDLRKHLIVIFRHIILGERPQLQFDA